MRHPSLIYGNVKYPWNRSIEMGVDAGYISWRYVGSATWNHITPVPSNGIDGDDGREVELSTSGGYVVWRYVGDVAWNNLFLIPGDGDDGREIELRENVGWVEWRYVGDVAWTQLYQIPSGGGGGITQVTGLTLVVANWVADGALYKYVLADANITSTSSVEVIPANSAYDTLVAAEPMPETVSAAGSVSIWAKAIPGADVPVTINITETA